MLRLDLFPAVAGLLAFPAKKFMSPGVMLRVKIAFCRTEKQPFGPGVPLFGPELSLLPPPLILKGVLGLHLEKQWFPRIRGRGCVYGS